MINKEIDDYLVKSIYYSDSIKEAINNNVKNGYTLLNISTIYKNNSVIYYLHFYKLKRDLI